VRPTRDQVFLEMAIVLSQRSTCARRAVGAILINGKGHIIGSGYNGVPTEWAHCIETACPGASLESGQGLEYCEAIHAEQNAIARCGNVDDVETLYVTTAPCVSCVKLLLNTGCQRIVYKDGYPTSGLKMWRECGRADERHEIL